MNLPLRLRIVLPGTDVPRYVECIVRQLANLAYARIEIATTGSPQQRYSICGWQTYTGSERCSKPSRFVRLKSIVFSCYLVADKWFRLKPNHPLWKVSLLDLDVKTVRVHGIGKSQFPSRTPSENGTFSSEADFDFNVCFGVAPTPQMATEARFGVLFLFAGDPKKYPHQSNFILELIRNDPVSTIALMCMNADGRVAEAGRFDCSTANGLSAFENSIQPYWCAVPLLLNALRRIQSIGFHEAENFVVGPGQNETRAYFPDELVNSRIVSWLVPILTYKVLARLKKNEVLLRHWKVGLRRSAIPLYLESSQTQAIKDITWIESPRNKFYADPFIVENNGQIWAFFEDCDYREKRGKISCAPVNGSTFGGSIVVLETDYHLSYPHLHCENNTWYMIPESVAADKVQLFRCIKFPATWVLEAVLLECRGVDSTLFREGDTYWMFVTIQEPNGFGIYLDLYSSRHISGPWEPHPENPLTCDVRVARGAGAVFRHNGRLYRPHQDCSSEYGRSISFSEILEITPQSYSERLVATVGEILPSPMIGMHTYNRCGDLEIVDGKFQLPRSQVAD